MTATEAFVPAEQVQKMLDELAKKAQDPDTALDTPSYVCWITLVDAMRMFTNTAKRQATQLFLPRAVEILISAYLTKHISKAAGDLRTSKKLLGCDLRFDAQHFEFN